MPLLVIILGTVALGFLIIGISLIGRRVHRSDLPWCRRCRYALADGFGDECPECGSDLTRRRAVGRGRRRSLRLMSLGLALIIIGLVIWPVSGIRIPPRHRPVWILCRDIESTDRQTHQRAWSELARRVRERELNEQQINRVFETRAALGIGPGGYLDNSFHFIWDALETEQLTDTQRDRVLKSLWQMGNVLSTTRAEAGKTLRYRLPRTRLEQQNASIFAFVNEARLQDTIIEHTVRVGSQERASVGTLRIPDDAIGSLTLDLEIDVVTGRALAGDWSRATVVRLRKWVEPFTIEVVPPTETADFIDDPQWSDWFTRRISTNGRLVRNQQRRIRPPSLQISRTNNGPGLSMDVFWQRDDDEEIHIEGFSFLPPNDFRQHFLAEFDAAPEGAFKVILRPNLDYARLHPGIEQVWCGELELGTIFPRF